jgi:site-specific DNA recombinase
MIMKTSQNDVVVFGRVSSDDQESNTSLESQQDTAKSYSEDKALNIIKIWLEPESAWKSGNRKKFDEMIAFVKLNKVRNLIFDCPDRASRNDEDKTVLYHLMDDNDVTIHFARDNKVVDKNRTPEDELFMDIMFSFSKYYSKDLSRKVKRGMEKKVSQNCYPSYAPFGYLNTKAEDGETSIIIKDPERYQVVIRIFEMCANDKMSTRKIAEELRAQNIITKKTKKRGGTFLNKARIYNLLRNPIYYGWFKWKGCVIKGSHPNIIEKDLFDKAQETLGCKPMVKYKRNYPFGGLITCGTCGCSVGGGLYKKNKYIYYRCNNSRFKHKPHYFEENALFDYFKSKLKSIELSTDDYNTIKDGLLAFNKEQTINYGTKIKVLEKEKSTLLQKIDKAFDAYISQSGDNGISKEYWQRRDTEFRQRIEQIDSELSRLTDEKPYYLKEALAILEPLKNIVNIYKNANREEKGKIIQLLVLNCTANEKNIDIKYKKPFSLIEEGLLYRWRGKRGNLQNLIVELQLYLIMK